MTMTTFRLKLSLLIAVSISIIGCARAWREFDVRLVDGYSDLEGRVEVYVDNAWGTICDDGWDIKDATVVCRQLGLGEAVAAPGSARFGRGSGDIVFDEVNCDGTEGYLNECSLSTWHACTHREDAGVVCSGSDPNWPKYGDVRLADGSSQYEGRVEVYAYGQWGTVCGHAWDKVDADVVCRQLGYDDAESAETGAYFGSGTGPVFLQSVKCSGHESKLIQCSYDEAGHCNHDDVAGVKCRIPGALSAGAIVGIVVGSLIGFALLVALVVCVYRSSSKRAATSAQASSPAQTVDGGTKSGPSAVYFVPSEDTPPPYTPTASHPAGYPQVQDGGP